MPTNSPESSAGQPNTIASATDPAFEPIPALSPADVDSILAAIAAVHQKMAPVLINLTSADRKSLSKLGDKSLAFVKKAVDVAAQHPQILPASHSVEDVRQSTERFQSMSTVQLALQQLYRQVRDTTIKTGSDAYAIARTIYAATKSPVAGPQLATAATDLARRSVRKPKATTAGAQPAPQ
jgi:hypothetical protein